MKDELQVPVTEIEIAKLLNDENMLIAGKLIIRKLAFERDNLKSIPGKAHYREVVINVIRNCDYLDILDKHDLETDIRIALE